MTFHFDHYRKVREERENLGLPVAKLSVDYEDHDLVGKQVKNHEDGLIYNIDKVSKHWYAGWYVVVLAEESNSHVMLFWENINCHNETILNGIKKTQERYELVV